MSIWNGKGFLGTHAAFRSDLALVLILVSILMLVIGWQLRLRGRKKAHCRIQAVAVILNSITVLAIMIDSFIRNILPGFPEKLLEGTYGITTVHAAIGAISMLFGIFVVARAYDLVPKQLRFSNYKGFMRTSLIFYFLTAAIGVFIYWAVFIAA